MKQLLTDSELSELLVLSPRQVSTLAKKGLIPCIRLTAKEIRFDPDEIERWLDSCRVDALCDR